MPSLATVSAAFLFSVTLAAAKDGQQSSAGVPVPQMYTVQGCFGSLPADATRVTVDTKKVSNAYCSELCSEDKKRVAIIHVNLCYCADTYPPEDSLLDDDKCNSSCPAYPPEACGASEPDAYSVFNTGIKVQVDYNESAAPNPTTSSVVSGSNSTTTVGSVKDTTSASASVSTAADGSDEPSSTPSTSGVPNNAAHRFSTPMGNIARKVQGFFNSGNDRSGSDRTRQAKQDL
ncbi:SLG1 [Fusarium albosuccineum]|uniref:SLG1 n=1 Tax=Fusarium albosuccineum TaxID=1237068 RepID=A0A8H4L1T9_9HYPO|nr:SLG1 [Fusarium albosuccineum]